MASNKEKKDIAQELQYSESDYFTMTDQNEAAKHQLVSLLKEKKAILMVGAGSSKFAGFPLWDELIRKLRNDLTPDLQLPANADLTVCADLIKDQVEREGRIREYYKFLERTFQPKSKRNNHTEFHCVLVKLGFSGIVTTNYDIVLETAVGEAFSQDRYWRCDPIDLCLLKPYRVFDFLRSLSPSTDHRWVLHLHGCFGNSERIILTRNDYLRAYGELGANEKNEVLNRILDTIHRKVIWALLAMHSLVFVGFSMKDEFFMRILKVVQKDFELDSEPVHFAIMDYTSDEDREKTSLILRHKGVLPVFYHVPEPRSPNGIPDHSGLERLVFELADSVGISIGSPTIVSLTRKMLER